MTWHTLPEPRRLLAAIKLERPAYRAGTDGPSIRYEGKNAAALRRIHNRLLDEAIEADDAEFYATGKNGTRFNTLMADAPDKLIHTLLSLESRFSDRIEIKENGCWEWQGGKTTTGYGRLYCGSGKYLHATHVSVFLSTLSWPKDGEIVCHRCDNPPCVNPAHLFVGTHADNSRDCREKGRNSPQPYCPKERKARGEGHGQTTLTEAQVRAIKVAEGKQRDIAAQFGTSQMTVWNIKHGKTRAHLFQDDIADIWGAGLTEVSRDRDPNAGNERVAA